MNIKNIINRSKRLIDMSVIEELCALLRILDQRMQNLEEYSQDLITLLYVTEERSRNILCETNQLLSNEDYLRNMLFR